MKTLKNAIIRWFIVALCIFSMASESTAENRVFSEGMVAGADSFAAAPSLSKGIHLANYKIIRNVSGEGENWRRGEEVVVSRGSAPTRVKIMGNAVLVPVTLVHGGNEADAELLLDTGASGTAIHTNIADQLAIDLGQARTTKVQVVGGGVLNAHLVRMSSLTIGPHAKRNWNILVVPHKSTAVRYDGFLGMDVLRSLKYEVDFKKQVIIWK